MSEDRRPDFDGSEAFTETSVLIELVQKGSHADGFEIVHGSDTSAIASDEVIHEFDRVRQRRHTLHEAMLDYAVHGNLDDFDPPSGHSFTDNDRRYMAEMLVALEKLDSEEEMIRRLRRRKDRTESAYRQFFEDPDPLVTRVSPGSSAMLLGHLKPVVRNHDDARVLVSAALWSENGGSGMFLTHDTGDMLSLEGRINETIDRNTDGNPLYIMEPGSFVTALFSS